MVRILSILHRKSQMYMNEQAHKLGLPGAMLPFIMCICDNPGVTQNQLCELLEVDKSTVAKIVPKLEAEGMIDKVISPNDCRAFNLYPTKGALKIYPKVKEISNIWFDTYVTKGMTEIEKNIFTQLLNMAAKNVLDYFE